MPDLRDAMTRVLARSPGLTAREIAQHLRVAGVGGIDRSSVNSCLYGNPPTFHKDASEVPRWSLHTGSAPPRPSVSPTSVAIPRPVPASWLASLSLYPWQVRALDGWAAHGYRGVVEAVTGAGKTRLALAAIESEIRRGGRAVAIVPTKDLQGQWLEEIDQHLIRRAGVRARVGQLGDGASDSLASADILVATVQSAYNWSLQLPGTRGLLVADEVHHYGAERWSMALEPVFERRLGLTATYERDDDGVETVLDPYFGPYRYSLDYRGALADDVIAHFKIAFVGVRFGERELAAYLEQDARARRKRGVLINQYGLTPAPFGVFMREVQRLSKSDDEGAKQAGLYLSAFSKRRQLLAAADEKFAFLEEFVPAIEAADSTILFSQTVEAAERAVGIIEEAGVAGDVLHAELDPSERQDTFDAFREGEYQLIAAPKLLDEGVDVPDADFAIILASSRSRRQMIQRMGRVIRKKPDGRLARVAIIYVEGTSEDPTGGAHEDFVNFVVDAADDVVILGADADPAEVVDYLNDW